MTDLFRSKMIMSGSKDRLRKALLENVDKYTISNDGRVLSDKSTLISAFKNELEKDNKIKGKTVKKAG